MINKDFNKKEFKELIESSDLLGLEYLFENEIKFYTRFRFRENYIYMLYNATMYLNKVIELTEKCDFENNFNRDLYFDTKIQLLKELGLYDLLLGNEEL